MKRSYVLDEVVNSKRHHGILLDSTKFDNEDNISNGLLSPPITPEKQRIINIDENSLLSKRLVLTPPQTPTKVVSSVYNKAKCLFQRGSTPFTDSQFVLPSREVEAVKLEKYLIEKICNLESSSMYVSGPPGTGKTAQTTASIKKILHNYSKKSNSNIHNLHINGQHRRIACVQLNCMIIKKPEHIFDEICKRIKGKLKVPKYNSQDLQKTLSDANVADISIVVLDELDNLISGNQQILFELFSHASALNDRKDAPKLILIGIANALDLTDRFLPRLKTNRINPELLQFLPYSSDQIKNVIELKLKSISDQGTVSLIHPAAIQLCSKKTAANTGDLRKLFDICHRSLEIIEETTRSKLSIEEFSSLQLHNAPKATIANVSKVCSDVFNATNFQNDGGMKLKSLNLQQKTVLCALIKFEKLPDHLHTINEFYEFYRTKVKLDNLIGVLKKGEFLEVITTLESFGVINSNTGMAKKTVALGTNKISGNVKQTEVLKAVDDINLLKKLILSD